MRVLRRQWILGSGAWPLLSLTSCVPRDARTATQAPAARPDETEHAPVHTAPAHTAPVHTAPAHTAPVHTAAKANHPSSDPAVAARPTSSDADSSIGSQLEPNGDSTSGSAGSSCERLVVKIGRNHGHEFRITNQDVLAGSAQHFDLRGTSDHTHSIELTVEEWAALGRGEVLRKQTERGGTNAHRHRVLVQCEPLELPEEMISACDVVIAGQDDHEVAIPESHVRAGIERHYDVQGVAGHTHVLTISAADFQRIATGKKIDLVTGQGLGHFHHVYIRYPKTRR